MESDVRVIEVAAQRIAAVRRSATRPELGRTIIGGFDVLWPFLRAAQVRTGRNVVIYREGLAHIEIGVEVFGELAPAGPVFISATPAGEAVTATHFGDYADMDDAYQAIEQWRASAGRKLGPSWEVYGHWEDDPVKRRTDVFFLLHALAKN
jgi:effector-binding domain-containing protein